MKEARNKTWGLWAAYGMLMLAAGHRAGSTELAVDSNGRTVSVLYSAASTEAVVEVLNVPKQDWDRWELHIVSADGATEPFLLDPTSSVASKSPNSDTLKFVWDISASDFTVYNLWRRLNDPLSADACSSLEQQQRRRQDRASVLKAELDAVGVSDEIESLRARIARLETKKEVCPEQDEIDARTKERDHVTRKIENLEKEVEAIRQPTLSSSATRLQALFTELGKLAESKALLDQEIAKLEKKCGELIDKLKDEKRQKEAELAALPSAKELAELEAGLKEIGDKYADRCTGQKYEVKKLGLLISGLNEKPVHYSVTDVDKRDKSLALVQIGAYPRFYTDDTLYAVLMNHRKDRHPNRFTVTVAVEDGDPINVGLVRPSFDGADLKTQSAARAPSRFTGLESAYRDMAFLLGSRFKPFGIPKVTISTMLNARTKDETTITDGKPKTIVKDELTSVTLLSDVKYPQVRGLYRYNFNSGVVLSGLRDPEFVKVKTASDDPATMDVDEARYRVDTLGGDREVEALAALTLYWKRVDIVEPVSLREALTPNPTLGFGLSDPDKDLFLGFSHSITRNVQLLWGMHRGKIKALTPRNEADEEETADAPTTREISEEEFFVGLTFNLKVVSNFFNVTKK